MPGPLDGYRVIDLTSMVSGPFATMMLGDQGAEVIKVETIGQGDHTRTGSNRSNGLASGFLNVNRNKRSIAVNLKDPRGRDALIRLARAPTSSSRTSGRAWSSGWGSPSRRFGR